MALHPLRVVSPIVLLIMTEPTSREADSMKIEISGTKADFPKFIDLAHYGGDQNALS